MLGLNIFSAKSALGLSVESEASQVEYAGRDEAFARPSGGSTAKGIPPRSGFDTEPRTAHNRGTKTLPLAWVD